MSGKKKTGTVHGGCLCGAVRFEFDLPSRWCAHCHCSLCRRAHGAAFVTWVGVPEKQFRLVAGEDKLVWFRSTPPARRGFCATCGTTLFFQSSRWPDEMHVVLSNVDEPIDRAPSAHAYFGDRVHWIEVNDDLKRLGE